MHPKTLGEIQVSRFGKPEFRHRSLKDEMRSNLLRLLDRGEAILPGLIGYEHTVVPQVINAVLSRHNMILLGLRGQAKSRILRGLTSLLDDVLPFVSGCEIHDSPFAPICRRCRELVADRGAATPISYLERNERYVEKLATPDVTIADLIGDIDPIRAVKGGHELSSEYSIHYGLLPRANRCIFAINELPDLASKIQVGLFNIMQEGDIQIKGYPIRLPLDVCLVFSANPEDYTARGKIVTPLKDRIGAEIRTHYPATLDIGVAITTQEAWTDRPDSRVHVPAFVREVVEAIAFRARHDQRIDKRSGVSQRLPISSLETAVSNAERRLAISRRTGPESVRISDIYASVPAISGKVELEYEGELKGAEVIARDLVRQAVHFVFRRHFPATDLRSLVEWFDQGGSVRITDAHSPSDILALTTLIPGLHALAHTLVPTPEDSVAAAAVEFVLEGLHALDKIHRNEENAFVTVERKPSADPYREVPLDRLRNKKPLN